MHKIFTIFRNNEFLLSQITIKRKSLVRNAYGTNASGKSNVLKAFDFYKRFITDSFKNSQVGDTIGIENFRLNATSVKTPATFFEATFTDGEFIL